MLNNIPENLYNYSCMHRQSCDVWLMPHTGILINVFDVSDMTSQWLKFFKK